MDRVQDCHMRVWWEEGAEGDPVHDAVSVDLCCEVLARVPERAEDGSLFPPCSNQSKCRRERSLSLISHLSRASGVD